MEDSRIRLIVLLLATLTGLPAVGQEVIGTYRSARESFVVERLETGLNQPWSLAILPEGDMLITERPGRLLYRDASGIRELRGLPSILALGQGGLLDVAPSPDYSTSRRIYFTYAFDGGSGRTGTALGTAVVGASRLESVRELYRMPQANGSGVHFGSRIGILRDGTIAFTIGDRGSPARAQDPADAAGSVIRLSPDGTVPSDNPGLQRRDWRDELYSIGHRNPQGIAVHPDTGEIWLHEHGPQGGDEINRVQPGRNYGWPTITYGERYGGGPIGVGTAAPGLEQPITYWVPSIAPSGMAFYRGDAFPGWRNSMFVGALVQTHLRRVELRGTEVVSEEVLLDGVIGRIRDVRVSAEGWLYLITDSTNGALYRIRPAN